MNQTFNIKRFCRYARFTLSMNRWYYGILFVACVLPASLLPFCGLEPELARYSNFLVITPLFLLSILPTLEWSKKSGFSRLVEIPASWLEKLIVEVAVRFSPLAIPLAVRAIGADNLAFAGGFPPTTILLMLLVTTYVFFDHSFDRGKMQYFFGIEFGATTPIAMCGFLVCGLTSLLQPTKISPVEICVWLLICAALFAGAAILYPKRQRKDDFNYESDI